MPLHDVLLLQHLVQRTKLPISLNHSFRAILVHGLEGRRIWARSVAPDVALLGPMDFEVSFGFC
jgi:hypothetical protein